YVAVQHSDGSIDTMEDEAVIYTDIPLAHSAMEHADPNADPSGGAPSGGGGDLASTVEEIYDSMSEEQQSAVPFLIATAVEALINDSIEDEDDAEAAQHDALGPDATVQDVYNTLTDQQKQVVNYMIGAALDAAGGDGLQQYDNDGNILSHQEG